MLEIQDIDRPTIETNELMVRVHAVGVNYADSHIGGTPKGR